MDLEFWDQTSDILDYEIYSVPPANYMGMLGMHEIENHERWWMASSTVKKAAATPVVSSPNPPSNWIEANLIWFIC